MHRRILIATVLLLLGAAAAFYFLRPRADDPLAVPAPAPAPAAPAPPNETAPSSAPGKPAPPTGMQPGEVRPGTRPDTLFVQPIGPHPPKEIRADYRVPAPDEDPRIDRTADGMIVFNDALALARRLHDPASGPSEDVQILEAILKYYRAIYRQNPVAGENTEVIRALTGDNPNRIVVFPDDHPALSAEGELLDRWGTAYYFHALSREVMDIWSAGPDTEFGTEDDVKLGAENPGLQLQGDLE